MKRWFKLEILHTLCEESVFSSEELDLLTQRINEQLDDASSNILRIWKKSLGTPSMMISGGFRGGNNHFRFTD